MANRKYVIIALVIGAVALFVVAFLIGFFSAPDKTCDSEGQKRAEQRKAEANSKNDFHEKLYKTVDAAEIGKTVRLFSARPKIGGTKQSKELADEIEKRWRDYGFDKVEQPKYNVYLPYINPNVSNSVQILQKNGTLEKEFTGKEPIKDKGEDDPLMIPPVLGFAKEGAANGTLLYVNYGRREDFEYLNNTLNISNCEGKIVIMRYSLIFRGAKVQHAQDCGAIGVIIYNDPEDFALDGEDKTYPDYIYLPKDGVQRGTLNNGGGGDPLTPGRPAIEGMYRVPTDEAILPKIPATPLSAAEAEELMKLMKGKDVPSSWKGGLNVPYKLGDGGLKDDKIVKVEVKIPSKRQDIYNVIGTIYGREEPDRWVMIGNHRDSWGFGAVDATSGTATILEISRVMKGLLAEGWRPRRTIKFCSWGAEESGLIGSTEWVEANERHLANKGVTYINVDISVLGNTSLGVYGSPLFETTIFKNVKNVEDPHVKNGKKLTVYEQMVEQGKDKVNPDYGPLGAGSDFAPFFHFTGVPIVDFSYSGTMASATWYPVYHSVHDTYRWLQLIDPMFMFHLTTCRVTSRVLMEAADTLVLPFDVTTYARDLKKALETLKKNHGETLAANNVTLRYLEEAAKGFEEETKKFKAEIEESQFLGEKSDLEVRNLNNRMVNVEKAFIYGRGLPGRPNMRHVIFSPAISDWYDVTSFPGITETLTRLGEKDYYNWQTVNEQVSVVYQAILQATEMLKPDA